MKHYADWDQCADPVPDVPWIEELDERKWSLRDLVFRMRQYESEKDWGVEMLAMEMFMAVHDKNILLDQKTAEGLGHAFDVGPEFFLNFHEAWRKAQP